MNRQECTIYSRVVGWITPTKNWNPGKKSEFADRLTYDQSKNRPHTNAATGPAIPMLEDNYLLQKQI